MCILIDGNVRVVGRYLCETRTWQDILRRRDVLEKKQKSFVQAVNLNSSEKVFYGGDTKFGYTAWQWIEAQTIETGKKIHHKMCGQEGERNGDGLGFK